MIGVDRAARVRPSSAGWRRPAAGKAALCLLIATALVTGLVEPAGARPTNAVDAANLANQAPLTDTPFSADPADVAIDGFGDAQGYHLQVSRGGDGFTWQELAVLRPADMDVESWTGYQCLSGDGRFAAVTILPASQVNQAAARDHGAFAYSVDLGSGEVHPIAAGVGLKYYSPGCGTADTAVFTTMLGTDQASTVLSTADLSTGAVSRSVTVTGQVTSTVPTAAGLVGVMGSALVSVGDDGAVTVLATVKGDAYDLRPAADDGVNFLSTEPGAETATVHHEINGAISDLGTGPRTRVQLFAGRDGGAVLSGYVQVDEAAAAAAQLAVIPDGGLAQGATAASLDGGLLIGPDANGDSGTPVQLDPSTKQVQPVTRDTTPTAATPDATVAGDAATGTAGEDQSSTATQDPAGPAAQQDAPAAGSGPAPVTTVPSFTPPGVDPSAAAEPDPAQGLKPAGDVAPAGLRSTHRAITTAPAALTTASNSTIGASSAGGAVTAAQVETAPAVLSSKMATGPPAAVVRQVATPLVQQAAVSTPQTPTCAVPRNDLNKQVMQPSPAQADWAVQMAEQGLLTGATYTRPAGYANMGFPAYAPSTDFPPTALSHPSGSSTTTVPRVVFEAIMAQESNFSQASWHSPAGNSGNPLIADYYGAGGDIVSINYAGADCGYGISQVTTGMHVGDHTFSARGQVKVAVDYQENIAAGLQILQDKWNQLYAAGIVANNGDPKYLENWYFAAWAYNGGVQPSSAYNSTGCTPGPACTGPHGTWGLGWTNNPDNLDYPPNRLPYLQATYADAAHPASWPYQERVMGWMASPIQRYGAKAYAKPTYNGGKTWLQLPAFNSFCSLAGNNCDPVNTNTSNPGATHCMFDDFQCWWHTPVTWIPDCATTCATSPYLVGAGSTEPAFATPNVPTCTIDQSKVPAGSIIVDDETSPPVNIQGCNSPNWTTGGTFTYAPGTNAAGDPIGNIDTHQLGVGLGGHVFFTHTEDGTNPDLINTGTWTPTLPSLQYYTVKIHVPSIGATTTDVVYTINPGGGVSPWKIRVNQNFGSEQWATIGTFAMQNGGNVVLTNQSTVVNSSGTKYYNFDVAYDAIAFVPQGGTPGTPIGGPPTVQDEPNGSNPAWIQCGCAQRTAGDPVNTATGYFGDHFTDLATPSRGMPLSFTRTYNGSIANPTGPNATLSADGPFGYGWTYSYNMSAVTAGGSGNVAIKQEDGSAVAFTNNAGTYTSTAPRFDATLTKTGSTYTYTRRGRDIYSFDVASGHLTAETTLAGTKAAPTYQTALAYDGNGHLSTITDPAGRKYTLTWTGTHITKLVDDTGRTISYAYDGNGDLTDVYGIGTTRTPSLLSNDRAQYTYVAGKHLMSSMRSPKNYGGPAGAVTGMTYDTADRVLTQTDPLGHTTTFTYGPNTTPALTAGQTLITDPVGHKTLDTYANSLLISEIKGYGTPDAGTTAFTYDPISLGITTIVDPDGNLSTFSYDTHGNRTSASNPLGYTTLSMWDDAGDLIESVDPTGTATVNVYDQAGHITTSTGTNPGGFAYGDLTSTTITQANNVVESTTGNFGTAPTRTVNYYYTDPAHPADLTKTVDANNHTTLATYDAFGDVTSQTNGAGDVTKYGYNTGTGWRTSTVDGNGTAAGVAPGCTPPATGCSTATYNVWGQVTQTTDPLGHTAKATFDADGVQLTSTDGNNRTATYTPDTAGRITKVTRPDSTFTTTDYNNDNTVADTIDALTAKTTYTYDGQGRQVSVKDPKNRISSTKLDPAGITTTVTDPAGRVTTLTHDPAGRTTKISYSDGTTPTVTFAYDPNGQPVTMTDGTGTSTWAYDAFGQLTASKNGAAATVGYGYDAVGNVTSITYPGQTVPVARTFDNADRLASVKDFTANTTIFGYDHDSALSTTTYPGGSVVTNGYNTAEQLIGVTAKNGATTLATYGYGRDNAGQVNSQTIAGTTQTFTYSPREQLATGVTGGATTNYAYDSADHPTTVGTTTATFDPAGQECWSITTAVSTPTCGSKPAGATSYTFDGVGQRTATTPATGTASSYSYDQAGRLTTATTPTGSGTYTYNGLGQRATKKVGAVTTSYVWDAAAMPNMLSDGTTNYLYGPDGNPIEQTNSTGTSYFVHDQIGSTRALLSTTGTVTGGYTYTPYGTPTHTGTASTPLQFSGQYTDTETGLNYLRARYYDPTTAQFLTIDPLLNQTGTPYAYVAGNPLNATDPSGKDCGFWCFAGIGAAIAVVSVLTFGVGTAALAGGGAISFGIGETFSAAAAGAALGGAAATGRAAARYYTNHDNTSDPYADNYRNPRVRGAASEYTDEELAQMAAQHAGDGYDNEGNPRPDSDEVLDAMQNGASRHNTGRDGNTSAFSKGNVRVRINNSDPSRSTCWYQP